MKNFRLLAALAIPVGAMATPPDAPTVTVSAPQVKQLGFKWNYVPRANYYELWFKANAGATEVKFDDLPSWHPHDTNNISAHLLDWDGARYRVKACNPGGCTATAPISVKSVLPSTLGFIKSTFPLDASGFADVTALSEDAQTLVVAATQEANDHEIRYPVANLYVYRRVNGKWVADARIVPPGSSPGDGSELSLSVDAAGDRFVVGRPGFGGYAGPQGEVYVYHRTSTGWATELHVTPNPDNDGFGYSVSMDAAGDALVFGGGYGNGTLYVYRRTGTNWSLAKTFAGGGSDGNCKLMALSGDASTLVRTCGGTVQVFGGPDFTLRNEYAGNITAVGYSVGALAVDATGDTFAFSIVKTIDNRQSTPQVAVYKRGNNSYTRKATMTFGAWRTDVSYFGTEYGNALALSSDGAFLVVGDGSDNGQGQGVYSGSLQPGGRMVGAVYVYQDTGGVWRLRRVVKPNYEPKPYEGLVSGFGRSVALGQAGKTLAVGHPGESTYVPNPDNVQDDPNGIESGAVWLY